MCHQKTHEMPFKLQIICSWNSLHVPSLMSCDTALVINKLHANRRCRCSSVVRCSLVPVLSCFHETCVCTPHSLWLWICCFFITSSHERLRWGIKNKLFHALLSVFLFPDLRMTAVALWDFRTTTSLWQLTLLRCCIVLKCCPSLLHLSVWRSSHSTLI